MLPPINLPPIQGSDRPHLPPLGGSQQSRDLPMPFPAQNNKMGVQAILSESSYQPPQPAPAYAYAQSPNYYNNSPKYSPSYPQRPYQATQIQSPVPWSSGAISNQQPPHTESPVYANAHPPFPHAQAPMYHQPQQPQQPQYEAVQAQQFTAPRSRPEYASMDEVVSRQQAQISKSQANDGPSRASASKRKREQAPVVQTEDVVYQEPAYASSQQFPREPVYEEDDDVEYRPQRQRQPVEDRPPAKTKNAHDREREALFVYKDLDVYDAQGSLKVLSDGVHDVLGKTPRFSIGRHVYHPTNLIDFYPHQIGGVFELYVPGAWLGDNWAVRELLPQKNGDSVELAPKVRHVRGKTSGLALTDLDALDERRIWGTDVYTDDSDPIAIAVHLGWLFDASDKSYDRRMLVGAGRPAEGEKVDDIMDDADLILVFRVAPRLVAYHSSMRHRLWSRGWGNQHDGFSLVLEECRLVPKDKTNVIRPAKQLRKSRIALIAGARKAVLESPSVQVKEDDFDYEAADENDVWKLLSQDQQRPEKPKFNKNTKMIRRGDRRFKRVQKEQSEIELETQLAVQQDKEQERLREEEIRRVDEAENAKKTAEEDEEKRRKVDEEEKKKATERDSKEKEEEKRAAEEASSRAAEDQSSKGAEDASAQKDSEKAKTEPASQPEEKQMEAQLPQQQTQTAPPSIAQQESSKTGDVEAPAEQSPVQEQQHQTHQLPQQAAQLEQPTQPAPEPQQQQDQSAHTTQPENPQPPPEAQPQLEAEQLSPKSQPHEFTQQMKAEPDVSHSVPPPAPAASSNGPDVAMEVDVEQPSQQLPEQPQAEPEVRTFSVAEAAPQMQIPAAQTFEVNQEPAYEPDQMTALSAQSTSQPAEAPQIMFVSHHEDQEATENGAPQAQSVGFAEAAAPQQQQQQPQEDQIVKAEGPVADSGHIGEPTQQSTAPENAQSNAPVQAPAHDSMQSTQNEDTKPVDATEASKLHSDDVQPPLN
ncbi:hypothetical protein E3P99_02850 [Wallemia hederae]|uniref:Uncharacterized protein n=1 Tax=Wallemia hederae TaxID=1540922 RepID=A0A4T0FIA7_9BASI|nr:hypothetical protein E3P99_02850 [Wallemia hederae]